MMAAFKNVVGKIKPYDDNSKQNTADNFTKEV